MPTEFSFCQPIKVDGSALLSGIFGWKAISSEASKLQASKYESDVISMLKKVYLDTWTATAVINAISLTGHGRSLEVVIVPLGTGKLANENARNSLDGAPAGVRPYRGLRDDPATSRDERYAKAFLKGTGKGSSARIEFAPDDVDAEKTLVHELLHALRDLRGQSSQVPTETVLAQYENEEEFFAMLIGNIFLSEIGRTDLRGSHIVYQELAPAQKTSAGFLSNTPYGKACRRLVNKFVIEQADVANTIKDHVPVSTRFNPIREFLLNTAKYPLH